jgi:hypothetical protein
MARTLAKACFVQRQRLAPSGLPSNKPLLNHGNDASCNVVDSCGVLGGGVEGGLTVGMRNPRVKNG